MKMSYNNINGYCVIFLENTLHMNSDLSFLDKKIEELTKDGTKNIAIKFKNDSYLSSRTGATIIKSWETVNEVNGKFALININSSIRDFLHIIDMENYILIFDSETNLL